jgi:hypothetical protein
LGKRLGLFTVLAIETCWIYEEIQQLPLPNKIKQVEWQQKTLNMENAY